MPNANYIAFIEKLIEMTKSNALTWDYLDKKVELYQGMEWTQTKTRFEGFWGTKEVEYPNFDEENSFYAKIDSTYIVLRVRETNPADLYIVPYTYKKVIKLSADMYGEHITRLMNIVQSKFPSAENFIETFLKEDKK